MLKQLKKDEKGQSMVEFALVLPIILVVCFATIQFGYTLNNYLILTGLARDAARVGSYTNDDEAIKNYISANNPSLDGSKITITIIPDETTGRKSGDPLTVNLGYPVTLLIPSFESMLGGKTLSSAITMRVE